MSLYVLNLIACYEGGETDAGDAAVGDQTPNTDAASGDTARSSQKGDADAERVFYQDDVNRFLADDRRKHEEKYSALEESYQDLLKNQEVKGEARENLEQQLEQLRARNRTKEQQAAHERKVAEEAYENRLVEVQNQATTWEQRYTEASITQSLQTAAVKHEAFNPDQVITQLRGITALTEAMDPQGNPTGELIPMVTMVVRNEDSGASEQLQMTPDEAVEYMKKSPERWGNFFKNNIREGIGSTNATGGAFTGDGTVDHTKLTDEQWFKLRQENPAALGLDFDH